MEQKMNMLKTGTTTLGIVCSNGVIIAADRRATVGGMIMDKRIKKAIPISDNIILTTAGSVSDAQLLSKLIKAEMKLKEVRSDREFHVKEIANLLGGMIYSNVRKFVPGITHFLLGGNDPAGIHLYDLFPDGSVLEIKDFVSSGSGSVFVYGVLESMYEKKMTIKEAEKIALKAMNAALQRDSASGNGIDMFAVTKEGVISLLEKEIEGKLE